MAFAVLSYPLTVPHRQPHRGVFASFWLCLWAVIALCSASAQASLTMGELDLHQAAGLVQPKLAEDGCFYLRARWMDPNTGRFVSEDPYEGDPNGPMSLHRYLYANSGPVRWSDPTGLFSQSFGYAIEREVQFQYSQTHMGEDFLFGNKPIGFGHFPSLKPDIVNVTRRRFNEIKPLSLSGIGHGASQMILYQTSLFDEGYVPDVGWLPSSAVVSGVPVWFVNFGGVIFYTDIEQVAKEVAVVSTVAALREAVRRAASVKTIVDEGAKIRGLVQAAFQASNRLMQMHINMTQSRSGLAGGLL